MVGEKKMTAISASHKAVSDAYEKIMFGRGPYAIHRVFGAIGFYNYGYWKRADDTLESAQINLIEELLDFFPSKDGSVLDVACGKGASSTFLTKYFDASRITGINISERQLAACRTVAPGCTFELMDAAALTFGDQSFDNVLCIEATQYFSTRQKFLGEAYRVLNPGGRLAMAEIMYPDEMGYPKGNYMPSVSACRASLMEVGFRYVRVDDVTNQSYTPFSRYAAKYLEKHADWLLSDDTSGVTDHPKDVDVSRWWYCFVYAVK